jgi:hypothetical protein
MSQKVISFVRAGEPPKPGFIFPKFSFGGNSRPSLSALPPDEEAIQFDF